MSSALSFVVLGFALGIRHATDADHVLAVATIVSRGRLVKPAAWVGALWGLGHTLTVVAVGIPIIVFNWVVAPGVGLAMEFGVGLMLILLGMRNLVARGWSDPSAGPEGGSEDHVHPAPIGRNAGAFGGLGVYQATRPLVVGVVHGLAGSAAVALLVLTTIREPAWAVGYLLVFGAGTMAGMVLITTAIALSVAGTAGCSSGAHLHLRRATGLLSFCFGLFLAYKIGVVNGLFSAVLPATG